MVLGDGSLQILPGFVPSGAEPRLHGFYKKQIAIHAMGVEIVRVVRQQQLNILLRFLHVRRVVGDLQIDIGHPHQRVPVVGVVFRQLIYSLAKIGDGQAERPLLLIGQTQLVVGRAVELVLLQRAPVHNTRRLVIRVIEILITHLQVALFRHVGIGIARNQTQNARHDGGKNSDSPHGIPHNRLILIHFRRGANRGDRTISRMRPLASTSPTGSFGVAGRA